MQYLLATGSARERGECIGEALRIEIQGTVDVYRELWKGVSMEGVHEITSMFRRNVQKHMHEIDEEIVGVASGANQSIDAIYALNARTELLWKSGFSGLECTTIGVLGHLTVKGNVMIAQNWDWMNTLRELTTVIEARLPNGKSFLTLTEAGIIAKIGLNNEGVGLGVNFLVTHKMNESGIPVHLLARKVLSYGSAAEAVEFLKRTPRAASMHYLVGDGLSLYSVETQPWSVNVQKTTDITVYTNSIREEPCVRRTIATARLSSLGNTVSLDDVYWVLRGNGVAEPRTSMRGAIETVHTVYMDLSARLMCVSDGLIDARMKKFTLQSAFR